MKRTRSSLLGVLLVLLALATGLWVVSRRSMPVIPNPTLRWEGLTNFPPVGAYTGYRLSNGGPQRLVFAPHQVGFRNGTTRVTVAPGEIIDRVGVLEVGEEYVFYVPGTVTNGTLSVDLEIRAKANPTSMLGKLESGLSGVVNWAFRGVGGTVSSDVWLGGRARFVVREQAAPAPAD